MSKSKSLSKEYINKFSGFFVLFVLGFISSILTGDFKSALKLLDGYKTVIIPIIFLFLIVWYRPKIKGFIGEKAVCLYLSKLDKEKFKIINNIMLSINNKTTQIDHVVVSNYGIFVIETKNYKGWIIGNEYDDYWTQVIYKRKEKLYNPIKQNYGHIQALKETLKEFEDINFYSIIAFSSNSDLKVQAKTEVIYISNIVKSIKKYCNIEILSENKKEQIINKLILNNVDSKENRKSHIQFIQTNKEITKCIIQDNICPKCGGELVLRNGKYGNFKGCSKFPKCRFIQK